MNVVGHQAVGDDGELVAASMGVQQAQVGFRVAVLEENLLTVVAPLCDVVRNTREYDSTDSGHNR